MNKTKIDRVVDLIKEKYDVDYDVVIKNDERKSVLRVTLPDCNLSPIIYLEVYENMEGTDRDIADAILTVIEESRPKSNFNSNDFMNWETAKDKLIACLRMPGAPEEVVTCKYLDMERYVRFIIDKSLGSDNTMASIIVKREMLDIWGITEDELFSTAMRNIVNEVDEVYGMTVLTNKERMFGANCLLNNKFLDEVSSSFGGTSFYILPSSIHECIAIPVMQGKLQEWQNMVKVVNDNEVAPHERLSYSVYEYNSATRQLKIAK